MILNKIKRILDSKYYLLIVFLMMTIFWIVPYVLIQKEVNNYSTIVKVFESISLLIIGILAILILTLFENIYYTLPLLTFVPFMFSHPFDVYTIPFSMYIAVALFVIGLIIYFIKFKPKFKYGHFLTGFILLGVTMATGGIFNKDNNVWFSIVAVGACGLGMTIVYIFFSSTVKTDFNSIAKIMLYLGIFLTLQLATYYLIQDNFIESLFIKKDIKVGWGISNNIALMLLFTIPFATYFCIINKGKECVLYYVLTVIQLLGLLMTYSRGGIVAGIFGAIVLIIVAFKYSTDKKTLLISFLSTIGIALVILLIVCLIKKDLLPNFFNELLDIDLKNMNYRMPIYKRSIERIKQNPLFGVGMINHYGLKDGIEQYIWCHSTILHTTTSMGIVGTIALAYHMIQKYFYYFRKPTLWKIIVILSLLLTDLYGLIDVSYYFINYMLLMIIVLSASEEWIEEPRYLYTKIINKKKK